jgi:hypothetical protein
MRSRSTTAHLRYSDVWVRGGGRGVECVQPTCRCVCMCRSCVRPGIEHSQHHSPAPVGRLHLQLAGVGVAADGDGDGKLSGEYWQRPQLACIEAEGGRVSHTVGGCQHRVSHGGSSATASSAVSNLQRQPLAQHIWSHLGR